MNYHQEAVCIHCVKIEKGWQSCKSSHLRGLSICISPFFLPVREGQLHISFDRLYHLIDSDTIVKNDLSSICSILAERILRTYYKSFVWRMLRDNEYGQCSVDFSRMPMILRPI